MTTAMVATRQPVDRRTGSPDLWPRCRFHPRQVAELYRLAVSEGAGDDVATRRSHAAAHDRRCTPSGRGGRTDSAAAGEARMSPTEVVEQSEHHEPEPVDLIGRSPVPKVGRAPASCRDQEDRAQDESLSHRPAKPDAADRSPRDGDRARCRRSRCNRAEPDQHDRTEDRPTGGPQRRRAGKERDQDRDESGTTRRRERRLNDGILRARPAPRSPA
jgi:hypothetical protein